MSTTLPQTASDKDAERIAQVCCDAINGSVDLGPLDLMKLKGSFSRYSSDELLRARTLELLVDKLIQTDPAKAARIADAIHSKLGK